MTVIVGILLAGALFALSAFLTRERARDPCHGCEDAERPEACDSCPLAPATSSRDGESAAASRLTLL